MRRRFEGGLVDDGGGVVELESEALPIIEACF